MYLGISVKNFFVCDFILSSSRVRDQLKVFVSGARERNGK